MEKKIFKTTQIEQIDARELMAQFEQLGAKISLLETSLKPQPIDEIMTRSEVAKFLKVTTTTLWQWNKNNILKHHKIGNKVRYYKSDVDKALGQKKQHTKQA